MTFVITQSCCNDASCVDVCPVDCIHPTPEEPGFGTTEMLYINPDECVDCRACQDACPVAAIYPDYELPASLDDYLKINADYFTWAGDAPEPLPPAPTGPRATDQTAPLRVAVVGAGPAGLFVAEALAATRRADVQVSVYDRLLTPFGLVRYGVAPDHQHTKKAADSLAEVLTNPKVSVRLGVGVGTDVTHEELLQHHHAVVYATGASTGRDLGIPGEQTVGSATAADFVGWYNGHPDHADRQFALDHSRAVVIGNGNVALDVARLLLRDSADLEASDMASYAVDALAGSAIDEVVVMARRGPEFSAFTSPELGALINDPEIEVVIEPADVAGMRAAAEAETDRTPSGFAVQRKAALFEAAATQAAAAKKLVLKFHRVPVEVVGDDQVTGLRHASAHDPADVELLQAGLVLRATGYRGAGVVGVPMDEDAGRFVQDSGRVLDPANGTPLAGVYTAGWVKRGPSGVIGTNRFCAHETVAALLDDYVAGLLSEPVTEPEVLDAALEQRGVAALDAAGWRAWDAHEREAGRAAGRPRVKVTDLDEQHSLAASIRAGR